MKPSEPTPIRFAVFGRFAVLVEKYVLSALFLYFGWQQLTTFRNGVSAMVAGNLHAPPFHALVTTALLAVFQIAAGVLLLINRAPASAPKNWKEIIIPLIGSYYYLIYNFELPAAMRVPLLPESARDTFAGLAIPLSLSGHVIALWAVLYLGRSFALLVSVRTVVTGGPYRYVRHPIYFAYFLNFAALLLSRATAGTALLVAGHVMFTALRATLEDARLKECSKEYRAYAQRTGFLWPTIPTSEAASVARE